MPEYSDHGAFSGAAPTNTVLEAEVTRLTFAAARVRKLAEIELELLVLALEAPDDDSARQLELQADTAWRDALALSSEHDPPAWTREEVL